MNPFKRQTELAEKLLKMKGDRAGDWDSVSEAVHELVEAGIDLTGPAGDAGEEAWDAIGHISNGEMQGSELLILEYVDKLLDALDDADFDGVDKLKELAETVKSVAEDYNRPANL